MLFAYNCHDTVGEFASRRSPTAHDADDNDDDKDQCNRNQDSEYYCQWNTFNFIQQTINYINVHYIDRIAQNNQQAINFTICYNTQRYIT